MGSKAQVRLAILLPCFGTHSRAGKFGSTLDSVVAQCQNPNQIRVYGDETTPFKSLRQAKVEEMLKQIPILREGGFNHVMMVDAIDSLMVQPVAKIISEYKALGSPPILCSAERNCYPKQEFAPLIEALHPTQYEYKYPCTGGWIGEIGAVDRFWQRGLELYGGDENDQGIFQSMLVDGNGWQVQLDHQCRVWQNSPDHDSAVRWERVRWQQSASKLVCRNKATGSSPCVLHFNGGYCDPVEGKKERMAWGWERAYGDGK